MNALIHQLLEYEDPMAANETMIEATLASLRDDLTEVKLDVRELRADNQLIRDKLHQSHLALNDKMEAIQTHLRDRMDAGFAASDRKTDALNTKIDAFNASLSDRMDAGFAASDRKTDALNTKVDAFNASLNAKIDGFNASLNTKIDSVNTSLTGKFDRLAQTVADVHSMQKAMLWIFGVTASFVAVAGTVVAVGKALRWF